MRAITKYTREFAAILGLGALALAIGGYIVVNQRLRLPFISEAQKEVRFALSTAQSVTPGQGQTVNVSGVRIGDIAKITLEDGRAIVTAKIDEKFKDVIRTDARALLQPRTNLKDMLIEVDPGHGRVAPEGFTVPVSRTLPDVNLDEILAALDRDTRDYLVLLLGGAGKGLEGRGGDARALLKRFAPTYRQTARLTTGLATRHRHLRSLIHSLNVVFGELDTHDERLAELVGSSARTLDAFAAEQANVSRAVALLPGTLRQTTSTLAKVQSFATALRPSADRLRAPLLALTRANRKLTPFAREATPIVRSQVRPLLRTARPLVRTLRPAASRLATATPELTRSLTVLNHLFNMLGYNPAGRDGPEHAERELGYLFWLAWLGHNGTALFSSSDANGPFRPVMVGGKCSSIRQIADEHPPLGMVLAPALLDPAVCGSGG